MTIKQYIAIINILIIKEISAMKEKSLFEQMSGTYTEINGILYPNLVLVTTNYEIGFWGQRHKDYFNEHLKSNIDKDKILDYNEFIETSSIGDYYEN